jgi:hypothetical protein
VVVGNGVEVRVEQEDEHEDEHKHEHEHEHEDGHGRDAGIQRILNPVSKPYGQQN